MFIKPSLLKINDQVFVNLNSFVSIAIEPGKELQKVKDEAIHKSREEMKPEDVEVYKTDWMCFYTASGNGLQLSVGGDITQEDFDKAVKSINTLELDVRESIPKEDS